jgi:hypothetical protein
MRTYRCQSCGATWWSYPGGEAIERAGSCLRCDGPMIRLQPPAEDPDTDVSPPVPNGLDDDAET